MAFLVSIPIAIAARVAGASPDVRVGIVVVATAALSPMVFLRLRARRRRAWAKRWQGPARMYRVMPPAPAQVAGGILIVDRGYLQSMLPGARYQFADDPSGFLL